MFQIVPCLVGGLFLFVLLTEFHPASAADAIRPNLIFIMADDPGYGEVGCYGQKMIQTPHLDQMAAEGMRFMQFYAVLCSSMQFYAGATVCAPSRSVLMTGLHHGHTRVRGNAGQGNPAALKTSPNHEELGHHEDGPKCVLDFLGSWRRAE